MTTFTATSTAADPSGTRRRLVRAGSVITAGVLNGVVFLVARAAGTDFVITDPVDGARPHAFAAHEIVGFSVAFALLGWATLALFERFTRRAARNWTALAVIVTLLSMAPIGIEVATADTRVMLGVIHAVVLLALLPAVHTAGRRAATP